MSFFKRFFKRNKPPKPRGVFAGVDADGKPVYWPSAGGRLLSPELMKILEDAKLPDDYVAVIDDPLHDPQLVARLNLSRDQQWEFIPDPVADDRGAFRNTINGDFWVARKMAGAR